VSRPGLSDRARVAESIQDLIGMTPMLRLGALEPAGGAEIWAKLEVFNPGGSIKDRAALGMIEAAEAAGRLRRGATIVEPTAGNTGIGLAMIGVQRGYRVILCVPDIFEGEKVQLMRALGGEVVLTPGDQRMDGAIRKAREIAARIPGSFVPQQFENPANPDIHYRTTGAEIYEQMDGRVDAAVLGAGTGGTFTGVCRYLRERLPGVRCFLVEPQGSVLGGGPAGPHKVEGIGSSFIPAVIDLELADRVLTVPDEAAFEMVRRLATTVGVLAGGSGGAAVVAACQVAADLGAGSRIVTLIPDSAERYLSKVGFPAPEEAAAR
jgi:cysteine synthase A